MRAGLIALGLLLWCAQAAADPLWEELTQPGAQSCRGPLADAQQARAHDAPQHAVELLQRALARCPKSVDILVELGESLLAMRSFPEARRVLEEAMVLDNDAAHPSPRRANLLFQLGFAREVTGNVAGAVEAHRALLAGGGMPSPNRHLVYYDLGDELMALGRLTEAIDQYRHAVALAPERPVPRLALAVALDRDGQVAHAFAEARTVLSLDPQLRHLDSGEYVFVPPAEAYYYRALALLVGGMTAEARLQLRAFIAEAPEGPYVGQARQRLAELARHIDAREIDGSDVDARVVANALSPLVDRLEDCLPAAKVSRVPILLTTGGFRAEPSYPAAACLDPVLAQAALRAPEHRGLFRLPLAGRRAAPGP